MIPLLAWVLVAGAAALAVSAVALGALGAARPSALAGGVRLLETGLVVQAVLDVQRLVGGHRPPDLVTHAGYLVASVVLLPFVGGSSLRRDTLADDLVLAVVCVAVAVVVWRLLVTWSA